MKKIIFALVLLFSFSPIFSQNSTFIKGYGYEGYIFNKGFSQSLKVEDEVNNSSEMIEDIRAIEDIETFKDIQKAEEILKENTDAIKKESEKKFTLKGVNFDNYIRQYIISTNKDGDTIVWMNMIRKNSHPSTNLGKKVETVLGGGNNFWSIYINITKENYYGLSVNGPF